MTFQLIQPFFFPITHGYIFFELGKPKFQHSAVSNLRKCQRDTDNHGVYWIITCGVNDISPQFIEKKICIQL